MALSQELVSQFAKITNNKPETNKETTVNGTFRLIDGEKFVQIDGSEIWTPVDATVDAETGERVKVQIKNHNATVVGNISSPSARTASVKDLKAEVDEFGNTIQQLDNSIIQQGNSIIQIENNINQQQNTINQHDNTINQQGNTIQQMNNTIVQQGNDITSINNTVTEHSNQITSINNTVTSQGNDITSINNKVNQQGNTINQQGNIINQHGTSIETFNSNIQVLNSGFKIENGVLTGLSEIIIEDLETNNLNVKYADIDFANINMAAVEKLFTDSGIIKDLVVSEGKITGELVGVTIKGDLLEGNTVKADKLVVLGSDGLYYKLNVNALGEAVASSDEKYQHGLSGSVLVAKSVTAEKVQVDDLVAFGATIGGFHITDNALYSGAKSAVDSNNTGIYQGKDGQFAVGDGVNFIKFYKDQNGNYKLDVSADNITFGSEKKTVESLYEAVNNNTEDLTSYIAATNKELSDLQGQIDGSIMTWFYEYVPTNNNIPASEWTTTDLKNNHLGDLFYDTITGYCYRWQVLNNQYSWNRITDVDVTKALADAKNAQDTADSKRRSFVSTPAPPYDVGDVWYQGSNGDIMRCQTAKTKDQSYSSADWIKASKYTDDTAVNALATRVTTAETNITKNSEQISLNASKTTEVSNQLNNLTIGGRNYLRETRNFIIDKNRKNGWNNSYGFNTFYKDDNDFTVVSCSASGMTTNQIFTIASNYVDYDLIKDKTVCISFDIKVDDVDAWDMKIPFIWEFYDSTNTRVAFRDMYLSYQYFVNTVDLESGIWTRLIYTIPPDMTLYYASGKTVDDIVTAGVRITLFRNGSVHYRKAKLEIGNKATDWSPAPEDIEYDLANNYYTKTETDAQLKVESDKISASVEKTVTDLTIGGRNYILNSANLSVSGLGSEVGSRKEFQYINVGQSYMNIPAGTEVTMSFDIEMVVNKDSSDYPWLEIYNHNYKGPKTFDAKYVYFDANVGDTIKQRCSATTIIRDCADVSKDDNYIEFYSAYDSSNWFSVSNLKLEIGNKATDWSPAPEDATDEINKLNSTTADTIDQLDALEGKHNSVSESVSNIQTTTTEALSSIQSDITTLTQKVDMSVTSEDVQIAIQSELSNGVSKVATTTGFTFDDSGLSISKTGSEMSTNIDEDGMSVYRNESEVLTADNEGVKAYNLHAKTYLIIGKNSRLEDYDDDRTGCFWIGG